jgi:hypothetical protein
MLFQEYMDAKADAVENSIWSAFEDGELHADGMIQRATQPLNNAATAHEVAEWFEAAHDDELSKTEYKVVDKTDDEFPDCPDTIIGHRFIHVLRNKQLSESVVSCVDWDDDGEVMHTVFGDAPAYPP